MTRVLEGLRALSEMKEHSGINNPIDKWFTNMFGNWKGVIISIITSLGMFLGILFTCGCCCILCIRFLCNMMIVTAIEKKGTQPPSYSMSLMGAMVGDYEDEEEQCVIF